MAAVDAQAAPTGQALTSGVATKAWYFVSGLVATLLGFTAVAHAANMMDPADGSLDVARALYGALTGGHYAWAGALALVGGVALLRKYGGTRWAALHTDLGSALLALGGAFGTSMAAGLAGGGAVTWPMLGAAGVTAFAAMGGYAAFKKIAIEPYLIPWSQSPKTPAWLKWALLSVIYWFQHKSDPGADAPPAPGVPQ